MRVSPFVIAACAAVLVGCGGGDVQNSPAQTPIKKEGSSVVKLRMYADDVAFLKQHVETVELGGGDGPGLVIVPKYQGRVMTSTFDASKGDGIGWINYDVVAKGEFTPHMTVFGGEDRIWLGPEGGQFSIYFPKGAEQDLNAWQTPLIVDTIAYDTVSQGPNEAVFSKSGSVTNFSGTEFKFEIQRAVELLHNDGIVASLGVDVPADVKSVAYESRNTLKNTGDKAWTKESGLLSVWILSQYKYSKTTNVVAPYEAGAKGKVVTDDYFGKVPPERLKDMKGYLVFKCDGEYRSKIGLPPQRSKGVIGSWDPARSLLTIVQYNKPKDTDYVNSKWGKHQDDPFAGDALNSYNDGPPTPGAKPLGPFYEVESSSPALALKPGQSYTHIHRTFHFTGPKESLQKIATAVLGVNLDDVAGALK